MNSIMIALNIIKRLVRERNTIFFLILFPILAGILVIVITGKTTMIRIGMVDPAQEGGELKAILEFSGKFHVVYMNEEEVDRQIMNGSVDAVIVLPSDYQIQLHQNKLEGVRIYSLKDDQNLQELKSFVIRYIEAVYSEENWLEWEEKADQNHIEEGRIAIGFLIMFLLMFISTTIGVILEDKKNKTFMRTFCAPVKEYEVAMGNLLASVVMGLVQVFFYLLITKYFIQINWGISIFKVFVLLGVFLTTAIGLGIGMSGFTRDAENFSVLNSNFIIVPTSLLGGCFFPIHLMPQELQKVSNFIPQKWAVEAYEKLAAGGTLGDVWINIVILLLFAAVFFTFGVSTLRPQEGDL